MGGTREGGKKTAETIIKRHGKDYYVNIGAKGGKAKHTKPSGFAYLKLHNPELLSIAGSKGGRASRRPKKSMV